MRALRRLWRRLTGAEAREREETMWRQLFENAARTRSYRRSADKVLMPAEEIAAQMRRYGELIRAAERARFGGTSEALAGSTSGPVQPAPGELGQGEGTGGTH